MTTIEQHLPQGIDVKRSVEHPLNQVWVFCQGFGRPFLESEAAKVVMNYHRKLASQVKMYWVKTDKDAQFLDASPDPELVRQLLQWGVKKANIMWTGEGQRWHRIEK